MKKMGNWLKYDQMESENKNFPEKHYFTASPVLHWTTKIYLSLVSVRPLSEACEKITSDRKIWNKICEIHTMTVKYSAVNICWKLKSSVDN